MAKMDAPMLQVFKSANLESPSTQKHVLLIVTSLECLTFTAYKNHIAHKLSFQAVMERSKTGIYRTNLLITTLNVKC